MLLLLLLHNSSHLYSFTPLTHAFTHPQRAGSEAVPYLAQVSITVLNATETHKHVNSNESYVLNVTTPTTHILADTVYVIAAVCAVLARNATVSKGRVRATLSCAPMHTVHVAASLQPTMLPFTRCTRARHLCCNLQGGVHCTHSRRCRNSCTTTKPAALNSFLVRAKQCDWQASGGGLVRAVLKH